MPRIRRPPALRGLRNIKPKLPAAGRYGPSIYNPSGRNQAFKAWKPPKRPRPVNPMQPVPTTTSYTGPQGPSVEQVTPATDYGALISGDWEVQQAEAAMGAGMARSRGDFTAQLRQQLIDLGISDPSKLGGLGQYIDADTIQAAVANKYSATAKNAQQAVRQRDVNNAALAARGMESSGATTKMQQDVTSTQEANNYSFLRDFLAGGAAGLSSLADQEAQYAQQIAAARAAAGGRAAEFGPGGEGTGRDQYGLHTDYSATRDTRAATAAAQRQLANQGLNRQLAAQRKAMLGRKQFLAKKPQGNYGAYRRAYRRQWG